MSSAECIDCDAVGRKFPHVAHRCTPLGGHFDRWPPLLIPRPKQIQTLSSGFKAKLPNTCGSDLLGFEGGRGPCAVGGLRGGHSLRVLTERPVHDLAGGVLLLAGGRAR